MVLANSDLSWNRSTVGDSEGGAKSVTAITSGADNNVFPDLTDVELAAGGERFRKIFLCNNSGADDMTLPIFWISVMPTNMTEYIGIGLDDADDTDGETSGGLTEWTANAIAELVSSGSDTRSITLFGVRSDNMPDEELIVLNGTTPVSGLITWSKVHGCYADAPSATRTVTIKQGASGTTRGTIAPNNTSSFVWYDDTSKVTGIHMPNLSPGACYGIWLRQVWAAAAGGIRPNPNRIKVAEDV